MSSVRIDRRDLLKGGVGALGVVAALTAVATPAIAGDDDGHVEGSWHATVTVAGGATFDTLYMFARGGGFVRVDGRDNTPSLGSWKHNDEGGGIVFQFLLLRYSGTPQTSANRIGTIIARANATIVEGVMQGPFTASAVDLNGNPVVFSRTGTFTAVRIEALGV